MEDVQYHLLAEVEDRHWWHRALRQAIARALVKHAPGRPLEILDAGCGTGGVLRFLAGDHRLTGLDLSPLALGYSRRRGARRLARGSVERLPFADRSFDAAVSIDVLSHRSIRCDLAAMRELGRVLRPGGLLILQLSAFEALSGEHDVSVHQVRRYTRRQVTRLLGEAGFSPISVRYRLAFLPPLMLINNALARRRQDTVEEADIALPSPWINGTLRAAAWLDHRLGKIAPFGSSVFYVGRRSR